MITAIGLDIAKNVFQAHATDEHHNTVLTKTLRRAQVLSFFANLPPCLIGIEACASSHFWARELSALGHQVRLLPAQYVKPFVRGGSKTDARDAAAICEAVQRREIPTVAVNTEEQQALQVLHRSRQRLAGDRVALLNQIRAFLLEFGIAVPIGVAAIHRGLRDVLNGSTRTLPPLALESLQRLQHRLRELDEHIDWYDQQLLKIARQDERCRRLQEIPGIGPVSATAIIAAVNDAKQYPSGRRFAASLGLVPREHSSGGKQRLLGISKRGDVYLRSLLVHGARAVMQFIDRHDHRLARWVTAMLQRRPFNVVAVALANKIARIVWAVLVQDRRFQVNWPITPALV
jgi:transposase